MTKQISKEQANALIAEKVMGWCINPATENYMDDDGRYIWTQKGFRPTEDLNLAFEALETWLGDDAGRRCEIIGSSQYKNVKLWTGVYDIMVSQWEGESTIAICTALLQAVGEDVEIVE